MNILTDLSRQMNTILSCSLAEQAAARADTDLRGSQISYLLTVCDLPGLTQEKLAQHLGVDKSNVARQLSDLEEKGYVSRTHDKTDRRLLTVQPTDRAFDLLPRLVETVNECQRELTRGMSPEERELLCELIARMEYNASRMQARRKNQPE